MAIAKKLIQYAKTSEVMNLSIEWAGKRYDFNLDEELTISDGGLNTEVKNHVRSYAFLAMLHKKLTIKLQSEEKKVKQYEDRLISKYSAEADNKVTLGKAKASSDPKLIKKQEAVAQMNEVKEYLGVAVRSYEIRASLLQTLAANTRQETKM